MFLFFKYRYILIGLISIIAIISILNFLLRRELKKERKNKYDKD